MKKPKQLLGTAHFYVRIGDSHVKVWFGKV